jgi:hypothetical protein
VLEVRQRAADLRQLCGTGPVGDRSLGTGVGQPVLQRLGPEQCEQRHGDGAQLVGGDVANGGLRCLRQQHGDAIAACDLQPAQQIGQAVRPVAKVAIAVVAHLVVRADERQGNALWLPRRPVVAHVDADVVAVWHLPAETTGERGIGVGGGQHAQSLTARRHARNPKALAPRAAANRWRAAAKAL